MYRRRYKTEKFERAEVERIEAERRSEAEEAARMEEEIQAAA